ncbi:MAG TPA: hypothetical protein DCM68_04570 [Verrucomicrobia bacterium]|nr:hypothetical protein [Verrucomicrobiota bacterium]
MNRSWKSKALAAVLAAAAGAAAQEPVPADGSSPLLTLGSPLLRSTMDRMRLPWLLPDNVPDFRLKVDRPMMADVLSPMSMDSSLRGVEIRLPIEGLWVGYETPASGEDPRATFSIQRGF